MKRLLLKILLAICLLGMTGLGICTIAVAHSLPGRPDKVWLPIAIGLVVLVGGGSFCWVLWTIIKHKSGLAANAEEQTSEKSDP